MSEILTPDVFDAHVGATFRAEAGRTLVLQQIDRVRVQDGKALEGMRESFSLIFSGPPGDVLPEGLHRLEVEGGPSFELYIMPVQTHDRSRQDYQAAFN